MSARQVSNIDPGHRGHGRLHLSQGKEQTNHSHLWVQQRKKPTKAIRNERMKCELTCSQNDQDLEQRLERTNTTMEAWGFRSCPWSSMNR